MKNAQCEQKRRECSMNNRDSAAMAILHVDVRTPCVLRAPPTIRQPRVCLYGA